jgi:hypothetical protein
MVRELPRIGPGMVDLHIKIQVAIVYRRDSYYCIEFMKFSDLVSCFIVLHQVYNVLYLANVGADLTSAIYTLQCHGRRSN